MDAAEVGRFLKSAMMMKGVVEELARSHTATTVIPHFTFYSGDGGSTQGGETIETFEAIINRTLTRSSSSPLHHP